MNPTVACEFFLPNPVGAIPQWLPQNIHNLADVMEFQDMTLIYHITHINNLPSVLLVLLLQSIVQLY
jgi:hypothetical protein